MKKTKNRKLKKIVVNGRTKYVYDDMLRNEFQARSGRRRCCGG